MLLSMNAMRLYEMVSHYAKTTDKFVLCIDNTKWFHLSDAVKATVRTFYDDIIPEDEIGEVFGYPYTFYQFPSQTTAVDVANDWFPFLANLPDADHFIEVQVIAPSGAIPYTNYVTPRPK